MPRRKNIGGTAAKTGNARVRSSRTGRFEPTVKAPTDTSQAAAAPASTKRRAVARSTSTSGRKVLSAGPQATKRRSKASSAKSTAAATKRTPTPSLAERDLEVRAIATQPAVTPIKGKQLFAGGAVEAQQVGKSVRFTNVETGKNLMVSRNIASTVGLALDVVGVSQAKSSVRGTSGFAEKSFYEGLMKEGVVEGDDIRLVPRRVSVDPKHPEQIAGAGTPVVSYDIALKENGEVVGQLLAISKNRFVVLAPELQSQKSTHLDVTNAMVRIQVAVTDYLKRRDSTTLRPAAVA